MRLRRFKYLMCFAAVSIRNTEGLLVNSERWGIQELTMKLTGCAHAVYVEGCIYTMQAESASQQYLVKTHKEIQLAF